MISVKKKEEIILFYITNSHYFKTISYLCRELQLKSFHKWFKYGLKAQKLLAQGIALGIIAINKAPCKGKSFVNCLILLKLLPLQGDKLASMITQGAALGYELLPFQGVWSSLAKLDFLIRFIWYVHDIP